MKRDGTNHVLIVSLVLGFMAWTALGVPEVLAEGDGPTASRKIWDNILLWVNFGILVFFFMKYARKPLFDYLGAVRSKIQQDMHEVKTQLADAKAQMDAEAEKMREVNRLIEEIRKAITEIGKNDKKKIIEEAEVLAENGAVRVIRKSG